MFKKIINFVRRVAKATVSSIVEAIKDTINNAEATIILTTSMLGISALIGRQAMITALPAFLNAPMVIPVVSTMIVILLTMSIQWRMKLASC